MAFNWSKYVKVIWVNENLVFNKKKSSNILIAQDKHTLWLSIRVMNQKDIVAWTAKYTNRSSTAQDNKKEESSKWENNIHLF